MGTKQKTDLAEDITDRICWALDIQCTEIVDDGKDVIGVYTNDAQTIFDIVYDELDDILL